MQASFSDVKSLVTPEGNFLHVCWPIGIFSLENCLCQSFLFLMIDNLTGDKMGSQNNLNLHSSDANKVA